MKRFISICCIFNCAFILQACSNTQEPITVNIPPIYDVHSENFNPIETFIPLPESLEKLEVTRNEFKFNKDYQGRDKLLRINNDWNNPLNEIIHFENLDIRMLEKLLINDFIDPNDRQNASPSVQEIFKFMTQYPPVIAGGYIVGPTRDDYRTTIYNLSVSEKFVTEELVKDFKEFCKNADELSTSNHLYCWWD